jgi:uncharacterized RDD family membrane protein YckC
MSTSLSAPNLPQRALALTRRLGAMLYDGLLLLALMLCLTVLLVMARGGPVPPGEAPYQLALGAIASGFYLWFWTRRRQTVGMRAWQLQVIRADGGPLSLRDAALRLAGSVVSLAAFGLGYLWILVDPAGLAWHDRLSGTRIVFRPIGRASA